MIHGKAAGLPTGTGAAEMGNTSVRKLNHLVSEQIETESEIHVLEVAEKRLRKAADCLENIAAITNVQSVYVAGERVSKSGVA